MVLEDKISKINKMMKEASDSVFSDNAPDLKPLENEMAKFLEDVKSMKATRAKEYLDILQIWTNEIKKIQDRLTENKNSVSGEINQAKNRGKVHIAYANTSLLVANNSDK